MTIQWIGSPNFDKNRKTPTKIVIHWMDGNLASADKVFQDTKRGTSAHFGVENNTVHQYVKEDCVAYHAGNYAVNQESFGIEHSAQPGRDASPETIESSAQLIAKLSKDWNIPLDRAHVLKHSEIKATQCPGTIPIDQLISRAIQIKGGTVADTAVLDRLRQEADDARKARDENWNLYQKEKSDRASQVLELEQRITGLTGSLQTVTVERDKFSAEASNLLTLVAQKNNEIDKLKSATVTLPEGALALLTLALKSALAGKWN